MRNADLPSMGPGGGAPRGSRRTFLRGLAAIAGTGVLAGGAGLSLAGCEPLRRGTDESATHDFDALLAATVALGEHYDRAIAAVPALQERLAPIREAHRRHAQVLASAVGAPLPRASASAGAVPLNQGQALAQLRQAEQTGQAEAIAACLQSPARLAPLLGSIAAARASHAEALA